MANLYQVDAELYHLTGQEVLLKINGVFINFSGETYKKGCEVWNLIKYKETLNKKEG